MKVDDKVVYDGVARFTMAVRSALEDLRLAMANAQADAVEELKEAAHEVTKRRRDCFISLDQAARYLNVDPQAVLKMVRNQQLPFHDSRFGIRFTKRGINKWLEKQSTNKVE